MKIGVYYISTGVYDSLFPDFLLSVKNLIPDAHKEVMLISDGLSEYDNYTEENVHVHLCPRINHYPWPVITLYKQWHILQNWNDEFDYVCYFNANATIMPNNNEWFEPNKIICSFHSFNGKQHNYDPWYAINISKESAAYLPNKTYEYVQGGFFFGPSKLIKIMCEDITNDMLFNDTKKHIFAQWHDESYFNKWCVLNPNLVSKKYIMSVYKDAINDTTFVYLRNKGNAINDFKTKPVA